MTAAPVNPALLELAKILAREAVRQFLEEEKSQAEDCHGSV
jgi:hypothetical protein